MNARNILAKKREFMIVLSAIALIACPLYGCGSSTGAHAGITRLDDEGYLYYMDYTKDYYGKDVMDAIESERTNFRHAQERMIDIKRQHSTLCKTYPGKWFISNTSEIEYTVISSSYSKEVMQSGTDDNVTLYK